MLLFQLVDLIQRRQVPRLRVDALHHNEAPVQGLPAQHSRILNCSLTWCLAPRLYRPQSDHSCILDQAPRKGRGSQMKHKQYSGATIQPAQLRAHFRRLCSRSMACRVRSRSAMSLCLNFLMAARDRAQPFWMG